MMKSMLIPFQSGPAMDQTLALATMLHGKLIMCVTSTVQHVMQSCSLTT